MLFTCDSHDCVVVYESGRNKTECPLCEAQKRVEELESEVETLKDANVDLADELKEANERIDALESGEVR